MTQQTLIRPSHAFQRVLATLGDCKQSLSLVELTLDLHKKGEEGE